MKLFLFFFLFLLPLLVSASVYYRKVLQKPFQGYITHVSIEEPLCEHPEAVLMRNTEWALCVPATSTTMPADCLDWNATACLQYASWVDCEYFIYQSTQSACVLFHRTLSVEEKVQICKSPVDRAKYVDHVKCQERSEYSRNEYMGFVGRTWWELAPESRFPTLYPPVPLRATVVKRVPYSTQLVEQLSV
jgi:hypothetical protein